MTDLPVPATPADIAERGDVAEQIAALAEAAIPWLRQARDLAGVTEAKARAAAIEVYARQRKAGEQAGHDAAAIVRWAERRQGQLLAEQAEAGERQTRAANLNRGPNTPSGRSGPTLAEQGITPKAAEAARQMAAGTDDEFTEAVKQSNGSRAAVRRHIDPDPIREAEAEANAAADRMRRDVLTFARTVAALARLADAPSDLALLGADLPADLAGLAARQWLTEARTARAALDRWEQQVARHQENPA